MPAEAVMGHLAHLPERKRCPIDGERKGATRNIPFISDALLCIIRCALHFGTVTVMQRENATLVHILHALSFKTIDGNILNYFNVCSMLHRKIRLIAGLLLVCFGKDRGRQSFSCGLKLPCRGRRWQAAR